MLDTLVYKDNYKYYLKLLLIPLKRIKTKWSFKIITVENHM